jgi:hypothetical protein
LLQHAYRRQPGTDEISETAADNVRTIANTVADKADDVPTLVLNQPAYNTDRLRQVGYVGASISESSVQRADTATPGLGALARLVMDNFAGTTFVKLFMYKMHTRVRGVASFPLRCPSNQREAQDSGKHFAQQHDVALLSAPEEAG